MQQQTLFYNHAAKRSLAVALQAEWVQPFAAAALFAISVTFCSLHANAAELIEVNGNIATNTKFLAGKDYLIRGEIHVLRGVTLEAEDGVNILILNGDQAKTPGKTFGLKSGLVFDTGSTLTAKNLNFKAADGTGSLLTTADNAGVFFMGSSTVWQRGQLTVNFSTKASSFIADNINLDYLGRQDASDASQNYAAIHVVGLNVNEWKIKAISSTNAGYTGLRMERSVAELQNLTVKDYQKTGIRLFDTRLDIIQGITASSTANATNLQLFDFEKITSPILKGPSRLRIYPSANVTLNGQVNGWVSVLSNDLPAWDPIKEKSSGKAYSYTGKMGNTQSYVYTTMISSN